MANCRHRYTVQSSQIVLYRTNAYTIHYGFPQKSAALAAVKPVAMKPVAVKPVAMKPVAVKPVAVEQEQVKEVVKEEGPGGTGSTLQAAAVAVSSAAEEEEKRYLYTLYIYTSVVIVTLVYS